MESQSSSSCSSSSSSSPPASPRYKKRRNATDCDVRVPAKEVDSQTFASNTVAALRHALEQSSVCLPLTHLRRLLSLLRIPLASASPAHALCDAGFLQLLPLLLSHSSSKVVKKSAEAVGLLAITSYEVSCRLAEKEILGALTQLLYKSEVDVLLIAIHSILNVATSESSCAALREVAGLQQQLMRLVSFLADTLNEMLKASHTDTFGKPSKFLDTRGSIKACALKDANVGSHEMPKEDDLNFLLSIPPDEMAELFDSALAAVNTIFHDFGLVDASSRPDVLVSLQSLWRSAIQFQSQFDGDFPDTHKVGPMAEFLRTPNRRNQLAKLIMKLAMQNSVQVDVNTVHARRIFGKDQRSVEHFFQKHWELSPARINTAYEKLGLSSFLEKIAGSSPTRMLELLVDGMVACPPAVADELDLSVLYKDMEQELGLLPVCNQDIRLLQCKSGLEILYPIESETPSVSSRDCVNAYTSGNTVVVRGLQFRWPEISAISNGLAVELGQVTVGANLYLTPPGAQGLGVHFDDHCVFVCQLRGHKRWDVYPPLEQLPRLYSFKTLSTDLINKDCATHYDLQEADVLYIPRGFLHEARTERPEENVKVPSEGSFSKSIASCSECTSDEFPVEKTSFADLNGQNNSGSNTSEWLGASLHLSFGVEVEPAFEWEGLLHIALRLWFHRDLKQTPSPVSTNPCNVDEICETLLHVAIRNVGSNSHLFRKACILRPSCLKQNSIDADADHMFRLMLKEVRESAEFHSAVKAYQKGLAWLDWLRHLPVGHFNPDCYALETSNQVLENTFQNNLHRFSQEASFLESVEVQDVLLCNFRNSRQKVMNGLLALHCGCWM
ncbi:hypothetical protein M758_9G144300 [Ceratodon purpureus]|nr:hypothetical protein M758_9G144300 [Ceratodon purpureus]